MLRPSCAPRARLALETLEARENPAGPIQTFDAPAPPALPGGWAEWSSDGTDVFAPAAGQGVNGSGGVVSSAGTRTAGRAWETRAVSGGTGAAALVKLDTLVPTFVFARGTNLGTAAPSYVAAVVTRGATLSVWEVTNGATKVLATVASPGSAYFSGNWARVALVPTGDTVAVQVIRQDTGAYLTARGTWQAGAATAIAVKTAAADAAGSVGIGRGALYSGVVRLDNFEVLAPPAPTPPPAPPGVTQAFDATPAGTRPAGWGAWASDAAVGFAAGATRALSPGNGFASNGGSRSAARSWSDAALPADVTAAAAVYLDSLIPAQVFVRGANLDTARPTYYAVTVTRGLQASLVRVVDGVETTLATVKSASYFSGQWLRVQLTVAGGRLQASLYRADTRQWLTAGGAWSAAPDVAFDARDAAIGAAGKAGVGRAALVAGAVAFDDFTARAAGAVAGPVVTLAALPNPAAVVGTATFRAAVSGAVSRVEFQLNGQVYATSATAPAAWALDTTTLVNGTYTVTARAFDAAGNVGSATTTFTVANPGADPIPKPTIPRHYSHIRVAMLAYYGTPMGAVEAQLLRDSVDLVVPNPIFLSTIQAAAPDTPQLIYTNVSNLYQRLLTDWLGYADAHGVSREAAFFHVSQATPWALTSASAQPVAWFWSVTQSGAGIAGATDLTAEAAGRRATGVNVGAAGQVLTLGFVEKFREVNVALSRGAAAGWGGVWEYATAVGANGLPTAWRALPLGRDATAGLTRSGTLTFDPPADWVPTATVAGGARLYSVRVRVTSGTAAQAPEAATILGRDYAGANGGTAGVIPAFDYAADRNGDGYLSDAEYATRAAGLDARFVHETRLFYPNYGQMRFVTNPAAAAFRGWAADYHTRVIAAHPLADGFMVDNATGKVPFAGVPVLESTANYNADSGALVAAVGRAIAPKWVLANTAGGRVEGDAIAAASGGVLEEFLIRPLTANWSEVNDARDLVNRRLAAPGSPFVVLDSRPDGGSPTDPRTQLATLAYYYLLADPDRTLLMFYGGSEPATTWAEHWTPAAAVNVGRPAGALREFATGTDPANAALAYKVLARDYENALVLFKPLSYTQRNPEGTPADATATAHQLGGNYRRVNADGTLGPVITSLTLRNGEGAVLMKA